MKVRMLRSPGVSQVYGTVLPPAGAVADVDPEVGAYLCATRLAEPIVSNEKRTATAPVPEKRG